MVYTIQLDCGVSWNYGGTSYDKKFPTSGYDMCYHIYGDGSRTHAFSESEMKQLMQQGDFSKNVTGCAYIRYDWKNHKNHLKGKQHEWWWNRTVYARAKVVSFENIFIEGVTKPKTTPRNMTFKLLGYNGCGVSAWNQSFNFVIVGDPYPIYDAGDDSNTEQN